MKCVRPELEMEASKEEQRGVVRFLVAERELRCAINSKRPGMQSDGIVHLH